MLVRRKAQTIKKMFPVLNGIFAHMNYTFRAELTKQSLDLMFVSNYGKRNPSPVVEAIQSEYGEQLSNAELTTLAAVIVEMYGPKWDKLGNIYDIEYDPIHNYLDQWEDTSETTMDQDETDTGTKTLAYGKTLDSTITRTDNLRSVRDRDETGSNTRTDNLTELETRNLANSNSRTDNLSETHTFGKTSTRTDNLTDGHTYGKTTTRTDNLSEATSNSTTSNGSGSEDNSLYGFNSLDAVNTDSSSTSDTKTDSSTGSKTNTGTQATAESGSDSITHTGTQGTTEGGSDGISNTGTQSNSGTDTGTITTANSGTQQNASSGSVDETITNTGTRTNVVDEEQGGRDTTTNNLAHTNNYTENKDRSGVHTGNIGNLTSQKQILEEINLWRWNYMKEILDDVKEFCTLPVYLNATEYQLVEVDED